MSDKNQRAVWMKCHGLEAEEAKPGLCVAWKTVGDGFRYETVGITREEALKKLAAKLGIGTWEGMVFTRNAQDQA